MISADMISTVGRAYLTGNIENDKYGYPKAYAAALLAFVPIQNSAGQKFEKLDIRFVKDNVSVLIETKQNFTAADEEQLSAYVEYEKALTGNKIKVLQRIKEDNSELRDLREENEELYPKWVGNMRERSGRQHKPDRTLNENHGRERRKE